MGLPVGAIVMWYKSLALIPSGWAVCNGSNGTPDLQGRFVRGVSSDTDVNKVFGAEEHEHSNSVAQAADDHIHDVAGSLTGTVTTGRMSELAAAPRAATKTHTHPFDLDLPSSGTHTHPTSNTTAADNLPPFVQVYFIMKVTP